jgi:hypothetical protein
MHNKICKNKLKIKELLMKLKNKKHTSLSKPKKISNSRRLQSKPPTNNSKIFQKLRKIKLKK